VYSSCKESSAPRLYVGAELCARQFCLQNWASRWILSEGLGANYSKNTPLKQTPTPTLSLHFVHDEIDDKVGVGVNKKGGGFYDTKAVIKPPP